MIRLSRLPSVLFVLAAALAGCMPVADAQTPYAASDAPPPAAGRLSTNDAPARVEAPATSAAPRTLRTEDLKTLAWRSVGPANMGGRVADIALAPGNARTFYVAFGTGGLFKTTNGGTTFAPVFDREETSSIGSVAVADAPADWPGWAEAEAKMTDEEKAKSRAERGRGRIVWVGTGEGNGRNSSSWGHGVYRSTDSGATFTHLGLVETHDIPRLAVHPRNPDICFVAALGHLWGANPERGVYRTRDGGRTWDHVLKTDADTGACDVLVNPQNPDVVYAALYARRRSPHSFRSGGPAGGIYRSNDGGDTWKQLTTGLPAQTGRIGFDIFAADPRILCAVIESDVGGWGADTWDNRSKAGGLFRSEDGGDTWKRINDFNPRPFYFSRVRIDPKSDQRLYLLGWNLYVSDDGGRTLRAGGAARAHVDMHALAIDPVDTDHLLLGSDGGLYTTYDRGKSWDFLNHLAVGQFYNIAVDLGDPYRIAGGLQDNGTWIGPSRGRADAANEGMAEGSFGITNRDWFFVNGGDGFHVAFDPQDPNVFYAESQGAVLWRIHLDTGRRKRITPTPKEGEPRFRFNWNAPFLVSAHEPTTLYLGGNHVFRLTQRGDFWEKMSDDLSTRELEKMVSVGSDAETFGTVVSLAESSPARGTLWAGTDDGLVHVTRDGGTTWQNVTPPQAQGLYISRIEASHHDRDTAYVAIDGHRSDDMRPNVVMTRDGGRSWGAIAGDLPSSAPVKVIREDRRNPDVLYAGTERAAFVTIDRGQHWVRLNGDTLPTVPVDDLVQHPREFDLVAGTHGRSIYVLDDATPLSQLTPEIVASEFHLFAPRPGRPLHLLPYGGLWCDRMFKAPNPPIAARIDYWVRDYTAETVSVAITDAHGHVVRELPGTNMPGLNRVTWDMQYDKPDKLPEYDPWGTLPQFVPAGEYTVTVSYGRRTASTKLQVLAAPGEEQVRPRFDE